MANEFFNDTSEINTEKIAIPNNVPIIVDSGTNRILSFTCLIILNALLSRPILIPTKSIKIYKI